MFDEILKQIMEEKRQERNNENAVYMGELPIEVQDRFKRIHKEREHYKEDVELRKMQYLVEIQRKLEEEFEERKDKIENEHKEAWNQVYEALMLDGSRHYYHENGKVYWVIDEDKKPTDFTRPFKN